MFDPKYTITPKLLSNIKKISVVVNELNHMSLSAVVLVEFTRKANSISAYASTSIEGNPLPLTEVKNILKSKPENVRDSEREVLNYNSALKELNKRINVGEVKLDLKLILKIHNQIMKGLIDKFRCGKLRKEPVVVNDPQMRKQIYLPPDYDDVPKLMAQLVKFINMNYDKIDPLILAGIFHKQFVIIHPFVDGNGRTSRLSTKVVLAHMGLDTFNLFSFENYYNKNVSKYFQNVGVLGNYYEMVNEIDFTEWLEYFTDGMIDELLRVEKELEFASISPDKVLKPYLIKMINYIKKNGFITDVEYSKLVKRAKATRNLDFNKLISMKIIERLGKGKSTYYKLK